MPPRTTREGATNRAPVGGPVLRLARLAALLLALQPAGAVAQFRGEASADRFKGWTVTSVQVVGLARSQAEELRKGLALSGQARLLGTRRAILFPQTLTEDLQRARLYLAARGHPHARVEPLFEPAPDGRKVRVTLEVLLGAPVVVDSLSVQGIPAALADQARVQLAVRPGAVLVDAQVDRTVAALEGLLRAAGYPRAQVSARLDRIDSTRVALHLGAEPGELSRFGRVVVSGVPEDLVPLVRKTVDARQGALYSPAVIQQGQDRLRGLGLFRQVRLDLRDTAPGTVDVHADLLPRKPRSTQLSVGYWTDDFLRARARWQHRNLLRAGRGLEVQGSASRFRQDGGVTLWWPALLGSRTRASTRLFLTNEVEDSYDLFSTEIELAASYRFSMLASLRAGVAVSDVSVKVKTTDPGAFLEPGGRLTVLSLRWSRDGADDRIYPTRGLVTSARVEWAPPGAISTTHFVSTQAATTLYRGLGDDVVVASRLDIGLAAPTGRSRDLLPNRRFFAGGATSMRGAGRRKLGPLDREGNPLGGEVKLLLSTELRLPLFWILKGALFLDAGQVWQSRHRVDLDDLEVAVGPGLMVQTPVGPVRADVGFNLTDRPASQPGSVFHLSIGHPF